METCQLSKNCTLFQGEMDMETSLIEVFKKYYCKHNWFKCSRFRAAQVLGNGKVPENLNHNVLEKVLPFIITW